MADILSLEDFKRALRAAAKEGADAVKRAKDAYRATYDAFKAKAGADTKSVLSPDKFDRRLDKLLAEDLPSFKKSQALHALAVPYAQMLEKIGEELPASLPGGSDGAIEYSETAVAMSERIEELANTQPVRPPAVRDVTTSVWVEPQPAGVPVRASARKAQDANLGTPGSATGEPLFQGWLTESGKSELLSYEAWLRNRGLAADNANRQKYDEEVASARKAFEKQRFEDRYCKAGDLQSPGSQRGHRLLRLPNRITKKDFRDITGRGAQLYEGPDPYPAIPPVDFDALLRRYIQPLVRSDRAYFNIDVLDASRVSQFYRNRYSGLMSETQLQGCITAATAVLQDASFKSQVQKANAKGSASARNLCDWLRSNSASALRSAVQAALGSGEVAVQLTASNPGGVVTLSDFTTSLGVYSVPMRAGGSGEADLAMSDGGSTKIVVPTLPQATRTSATLRAELDKLVALYEKAWTLAVNYVGQQNLWNGMGAKLLSPYEFRSYVYILASLKTNLLPPVEKAAFAAYIEAQTAAGAMLARPRLDAVEGAPKVWTDAGGLTTEAQYDLERMVDGYRHLLDVVLTFQPLTAPEAAAAAPPQGGLSGALSGSVTSRWIDTFQDLLAQFIQRRRVIDRDRLVLRLTPRKGAYGEVPTGKKGRTELSPEHPVRMTESYRLDTLDDKYLNIADPRFYLREDYILQLKHQGFGIGRHLYSMSLLPEEDQVITVKSFKGTTVTESESSAENIFEEQGSETSSDFAREVQKENQSESSDSSSISVSAKASASYGCASGSVEAGYNAQSSSREFSKNVSSTTDRLASKLSSKRNVSIETKRDKTTSTEEHTDLTTERKIKNPNKGHTLTFNWFQTTRKFSQQLWLDEIKLIYSSGYFPPIRIYVREPELPASLKDSPFAPLLATMPRDVADEMPPGSVVYILAEPYTEVMSLGQATARLAYLLQPAKAMDVASTIWTVLGYGASVPDGIGVLAFSGNHDAAAGAAWYVELFNAAHADAPAAGAAPNPDATKYVVADEVQLYDADNAKVGKPIYVPNLDLRVKQSDDFIPSRYMGAPGEVYGLPRLLSSEARVIDTNGVFCDVMVGNCTALEDYIQRSRELDLLSNKIKVGLQEIELRWAAAKDELEIRSLDGGEAIEFLVQENGNAFRDRLAVETARLTAQKDLATANFEKKRLEQEIELLKKKAVAFDRAPDLKVDVPEGTSLTVKASLEHQGAANPP